MHSHPVQEFDFLFLFSSSETCIHINGKVDLQACKSINEETGAEEQDSSHCIQRVNLQLMCLYCLKIVKQETNVLLKI